MTSTATAEDELLLILVRNLRNAAATFGEGSAPYLSIRATIQEHLDEMRQKGLTTNLTLAAAGGGAAAVGPKSPTATSPTTARPPTFANLAFRPKPAAG